MKTDFNEIIDRRHTGSYKWDTADDVINMWVADMDFRTAPAIIEALQKRVSHGVFGYTAVEGDYYNAVCGWFQRRHKWRIDPQTIIYTSGVVPAVSAILKAVTMPGEKVVLQTPAYNCFYSSIRNNGCEPLSNPLIYDSTTGCFSLDLDGLERLASDEKATAMIICNPHNPSGRVWTPDELTAMAEIARRHNVFIISDEIHCELCYKPYAYTPYGTLPPIYQGKAAICISPSKAFNTAGLQIANIVASDPEIRRRIDRAININEVCDVNPFGVIATMAAYNESEQWLDQLIEYLHGNYRLLVDRLSHELPALKVTPLEATYLAWVNIASTSMTGDELAERLLDEQRLRINSGSMYGPGGEDFIRINLACPRSVVDDAIDRIVATLNHDRVAKKG